MTALTKKPNVFILCFLLSFSNVLGMMYAAALPSLTHYFRITQVEAQKTISFYLIGALFAQIFYAPIAKAIGRKPTIYLGCTFALLGAILCLVAIHFSSFSLLLFGRGITAFGAACGLILTNIMLSDAFSIHEQKKMLSYLMSSVAVFPALSVALGGVITEYISWKGCFYLLVSYAILVSILCTFLPETTTEKGLHHLNLKRVVKAYFRQFSQALPLLYMLFVSCVSILLYVFSAEAPFIATNQLHISADHFGLYNLLPNIGLFLGGIASAHIGHRFSSKTLLFVGSMGFFLFSVAMWWFFKIGLIHVYSLFGIPALIYFVSPTLLSQGQVSATSKSEDKVYASSFLYVLQYFGMFFSVKCLGFLSHQGFLALPIVYTCSGALMLLLWIMIKILSRKKERA